MDPKKYEQGKTIQEINKHFYEERFSGKNVHPWIKELMIKDHAEEKMNDLRLFFGLPIFAICALNLRRFNALSRPGKILTVVFFLQSSFSLYMRKWRWW